MHQIKRKFFLFFLPICTPYRAQSSREDVTNSSSRPASIYGYADRYVHQLGNYLTNPIHRLTSGCSLLIAGSVADLVGTRIVYLIGCFLLAICVLACGLAKTGTQLIIFRGMQGIAVSFCLPTAVSILTEAFPNGRRRNTGFALLGAGQPLGFSLGLVFSGIFVDSIGWRSGYYVCAALFFLVLGAGFWGLPKDSKNRGVFAWRRLFAEIDWLGAVVSSACIGIWSYLLA